MGSTGTEPEGKKGLQFKWAVEWDLAADWYIHRGIRPNAAEESRGRVANCLPQFSDSHLFHRREVVPDSSRAGLYLNSGRCLAEPCLTTQATTAPLAVQGV